jgi:ribose transport system permease protein
MPNLATTVKDHEAREAPAPPPPRISPLTAVARFLLVDGLLLLALIVAAVAFSIALPDTFPTRFNINSILSAKSVVALTALAVLVPLAANEYDLSVGYVVGLTHILAIGLQTKAGLPWPVAVLLVLLAGSAVGLVNGLLVTKLQINSFIATLGMGTFIYGVSGWYTKGHQVVGSLPDGFSSLTGTVAGIPAAALYALAAALILWAVLEYLPIGRHLLVLGANARAAELTGIPVQRYVLGSFVTSGFLTACAGVVLASQLQLGQLATGPDYLLPAFAAVLLGATAFGKGRVNVWGTIVAVLLLAVIVAGLQQLGADFYVEPLFNGGILVAAVALAGYAGRRRLKRQALDETRRSAEGR